MITDWETLTGRTFTSQGRTFTDAEIALLTDLTWTGHDLHSNSVAMRRHPAGERILAGPCVLASVLGQIASGGWAAIMAAEYQIQPMGLLATDEVRFHHSIVPGSTMVATTEVISARASESRPGCGILTNVVRGVDAEDPKILFVSAIEVTLWGPISS